MLVCAFLPQFAHETAGAARTRSSLRPLTFRGGETKCKTSGASRRENAELCLPSLRAKRSNPFFLDTGTMSLPCRNLLLLASQRANARFASELDGRVNAFDLDRGIVNCHHAVMGIC